MNTLVVTDAHVVSLDASIGSIPSCDILVVDGRIAAVETGLAKKSPEAERVDGSGTIALPGFVDTHRHLWETVIRGALASGSLGDYFGAVILGCGPNFGPDDMYAGGLIGAYEALNAGVTTVVDWCNNTLSPDHADAAVKALQDSGIRAMFAYGTPTGAEWNINSKRTHPADVVRVKEEYFSSDDQLLTYALAVRGPILVGADTNADDFRLARELDARITVHAGMRLPGLPNGEVALLNGAGLLGPDLTIVHGNETSDAELTLLARHGSTVSVSPYVELVMGHGVPPTNRLLAHGLRPSLSMDVACTSPGDMFTQMRTALAHSRGAQLPASPQGEFRPQLTVDDVLRFATIDGAAACGLERRIGTLAVGKDADIILIRSDSINTLPAADDPVAAVVAAADTSNVDTVLVRGRLVKQNGRLVGVDMPQLNRLGAEARNRVLRRS